MYVANTTVLLITNALSSLWINATKWYECKQDTVFKPTMYYVISIYDTTRRLIIWTWQNSNNFLDKDTSHYCCVFFLREKTISNNYSEASNAFLTIKLFISVLYRILEYNSGKHKIFYGKTCFSRIKFRLNYAIYQDIVDLLFRNKCLQTYFSYSHLCVIW